MVLEAAKRMQTSSSAAAAGPPRKVHEVFGELAAKAPDAVAVVSRGHHRSCQTYAALCERASVLAAGLVKRRMAMQEANGGTDAPSVVVRLSRTHPDFVPVLVAASRAGLPFVLLSTDLPDCKLQASRNDFILSTLKPWLLITEASSPPGTARDAEAAVPSVALADLEQEEPVALIAQGLEHAPSSDVWCFLFTGGTHRTKVVQVTHAMLIHERTAYGELWQPKTLPAVVLAHTSAYWAASALGQLSIALAFGGTAVLTEATEVSDLRRCISEERVTVLGLVPDHLDLLAPQAPQEELPGVEIVFTWGERLPTRLVDRWRGHPRAVLRELLISTEYWLCLWADPAVDGTLRTVRGSELLLLAEDGQEVPVAEASVGALGELCISGPMVMMGYLPGCGPADSEVFHVPKDGRGRRFFRTRDLVRRVPGGIVYKGRSDMMAKHKGKWVDMLAVEDELAALPAVAGAKILPDPEQEHFHAFVVLEAGKPAELAAALDAVRAALPPRTQLWKLPTLPRHPVTRKVDAKRLLAMATDRPMSWPLEGDPHLAAAPYPLRGRFLQKASNQLAWSLFGLVAALGVAEEGLLARSLALCLATLQLSHIRDRAAGSKANSPSAGLSATCYAVTSNKALAAWFAALLLGGPLTPRRFARAAASMAALAYTWLTLTYADDARKRSLAARAVMAVVDELPGWKMGAFLLLAGLSRLGWPRPLRRLAGAALAGTAGFGAVTAAQRGRLLAWPVVFWTMGIGHQLAVDCQSWLQAAAWRKYADTQLTKMQSAAGRLREVLAKERFRALGGAPAAAPAPPGGAGAGGAGAGAEEDEPELIGGGGACTGVPPRVEEEEEPTADLLEIDLPETAVLDGQDAASAAAPTCGNCVTGLGGERWPARSAAGQPLCDACGAEVVSERERSEAEWLAGFLTSARGGAEEEPVAAEASHNIRGGGDAELMAAQRDQQQAQSWWWYRHSCDIIDFSKAELRRHQLVGGAPRQEDADAAAAAAAPPPPELRPLCSIVAEVDPLLKPVRGETVILGLDSLRVAKLSTAVRRRLGKNLTAPQIREARTVAELAAVAAEATEEWKAPGDGGARTTETSSSSREFAIWFAPGQCSAMGHWILRSEERLDREAFVQASQKLVERHAAFRVKAVDPLRYTSFVFDAGALFALYAPLLSAGPPFARALRRLVSWAFTLAWPRVRCYSREEMYGSIPETKAPVEIVEVHGGQIAFEREIRDRREGMPPPGSIVGFEVFCHLADVWEYHRWKGSFAILKPKEGPIAEAASKAGASLVYVDQRSEEWGPLLAPSSPRWHPPPYGFPALFFVPLAKGGLLWLRLESPDELRVCYKEAGAHGTRPPRNQPVHHLAAFRADPRRRSRDVHEPVVVSFVGICMWHAFADGNCYMPLVQDLLLLYDAARGRSSVQLAQLGNPFEELERRLFDTFLCRPSPMRFSMRGSMFRFGGRRGYGHTLGLLPGAIAALTAASGRYHVPLDVILLALLVIAMARTDAVEVIEFTLYTPMRDGDANSMAVGLFSDWRDLSLTVDFELATTLGTILQVFHKIQHRKWTVYNALRKPERTVVNMHPMQFDPIAGFVQIGENMWHGGDRIGRTESRGDEMGNAAQPANFVIEQQDEATWWVLAAAAHDIRPTNWMRAFVYAYREAVRQLLFDPSTLVHGTPLPDDNFLLQQCEQEDEASEGLWNWN